MGLLSKHLTRSSVLLSTCFLYTGLTISVYAEDDLTNKEYIWEKLLDAGYSQESAAGIMSGIDGVSGYDSTYVQGNRPSDKYVIGATGMGLCQWTAASDQKTLIKKVEDAERDWTDLETQVDFLIENMESFNWYSPCNSLEEYKVLDDVSEASEVFLEGYLRLQNITEETIQGYANNAVQIYNEFYDPNITTNRVVSNASLAVEDNPETYNYEEIVSSSDSTPVIREIKEIEPEEIELTSDSNTANETAAMTYVSSGLVSSFGLTWLFPVGIGTSLPVGAFICDRKGILVKLLDSIKIRKFRKKYSLKDPHKNLWEEAERKKL